MNKKMQRFDNSFSKKVPVNFFIILKNSIVTSLDNLVCLLGDDNFVLNMTVKMFRKMLFKIIPLAK